MAVKARAIRKVEVDARKAAAEQERINQEARDYLAQTDWYVVRQADTGEPVPTEVREARAAARRRVVHEQGTSDLQRGFT